MRGNIGGISSNGRSYSLPRTIPKRAVTYREHLTRFADILIAEVLPNSSRILNCNRQYRSTCSWLPLTPCSWLALPHSQPVKIASRAFRYQFKQHMKSAYQEKKPVLNINRSSSCSRLYQTTSFSPKQVNGIAQELPAAVRKQTNGANKLGTAPATRRHSRNAGAVIVTTSKGSRKTE